jgi:hypothetical protein
MNMSLVMSFYREASLAKAIFVRVTVILLITLTDSKLNELPTYGIIYLRKKTNKQGAHG